MKTSEGSEGLATTFIAILIVETACIAALFWLGAYFR